MEKASVLNSFKGLYRDWIKEDVKDILLVIDDEMARIEILTGQGSKKSLDLKKLKDVFYNSQSEFFENDLSIEDIITKFQYYEYEELLADLFGSYTDKSDVDVIQSIFSDEAINRIELLNNCDLDTNSLQASIDDMEQGDYLIEISEMGSTNLLVFKSMNSMIDFLRFHYPAYARQPHINNTISDFEIEHGERFFETFDREIKAWENQKEESGVIKLLNSLEFDSYLRNLSINWFGSFIDYHSGINSYSNYIKKSCQGDADAFMKYLKDDICIHKHYAQLIPFLEMPFESTMDMDKDQKIYLFDFLDSQLNEIKKRVESTIFETLKEAWSSKVASIEKELKNWRGSVLGN